MMLGDAWGRLLIAISNSWFEGWYCHGEEFKQAPKHDAKRVRAAGPHDGQLAEPVAPQHMAAEPPKKVSRVSEPPEVGGAGQVMAKRDLWASIWSEVTKTANTDGLDFQDLKNYIKFIGEFREFQEEAGCQFVGTPLGAVGTSEQQLAAFLHHQRYHGTTPELCTAQPAHSKALYKILGKVRTGLSEFSHIVEIPPCLIANSSYSLWLKKKLSAWKVPCNRLVNVVLSRRGS
jgi:hypothetical protein